LSPVAFFFFFVVDEEASDPTSSPVEDCLDGDLIFFTVEVAAVPPTDSSYNEANEPSDGVLLRGD